MSGNRIVSTQNQFRIAVRSRSTIPSVRRTNTSIMDDGAEPLREKVNETDRS